MMVVEAAQRERCGSVHRLEKTPVRLVLAGHRRLRDVRG